MQSGAIWMELHVLQKHGWSVSALAREFGLNWRTIKRELASPGPRSYPKRAKPTALSEAQLRHVERRLVVCPTIRGTDLHAELCHDYAYQGSYPAFARQLRVLRPAPVHDPEIRFETGPGEQTQVDWAQLGSWRVGDALVELNALVAILGCSRAPAIRFAPISGGQPSTEPSTQIRSGRLRRPEFGARENASRVEREGDR